MLKKARKITLQLMAGANVATLLLMLLVGYAGRLNPVEHALLSNLNFAFPLFLVINVVFIVFWVLFKLHYVIIPVVGFIICYQPVRAYFPVNVPAKAPDGAIKVLSFNVWVYGIGDEERASRILEYIKNQKADIVCLQEAFCENEKMRTVIDSTMGILYKYSEMSEMGPNIDRLVIYSRFPIVNKERIYYESPGNHSAAFILNIGGEKVLVVNNHLQTMALTNEDRDNFKTMVKGKMTGDSAKRESQRLIDKLADASRIRAPQAEAVHEYIKKHNYMSIICVGDFNDSPLSYAHNTICKGLMDCFVASGNGLGVSYNRSAFFVRIDNIMCSDDWKPYRCKVDDSIDASDHYPIMCWLKKRE